MTQARNARGEFRAREDQLLEQVRQHELASDATAHEHQTELANRDRAQADQQQRERELEQRLRTEAEAYQAQLLMMRRDHLQAIFRVEGELRTTLQRLREDIAR